jgi:hypothetical protein
MSGEKRHRLVHRRYRTGLALQKECECHAGAGRQTLRLGIGLRTERPGGDNHPRCVMSGGGLERLAVAPRDRRASRVDEVGESVRQTELGGPDTALRR